MKSFYPKIKSTDEKVCLKTVDKAVFNEEGVPLSERVSFKNLNLGIIGCDGIPAGPYLSDSDAGKDCISLLAKEFKSCVNYSMTGSTLAITHVVDGNGDTIVDPRIRHPIVNNWQNLDSIYIDPSDSTYYDASGNHYTHSGLYREQITLTRLEELINSNAITRLDYAPLDVVMVLFSVNDWTYDVPIGEDNDGVARMSRVKLEERVSAGELTINTAVKFTRPSNGNYYQYSTGNAYFNHYKSDGSSAGGTETMDSIQNNVGNGTLIPSANNFFIGEPDGSYYDITGVHYDSSGNIISNLVRNETTYRGALNIIIDGLLTKYAGKEVIFVTPISKSSLVDKYGSSDNHNKHGHTLKDYVDVIKELAMRHSIPVIDLYSTSGMDFTHNITHVTVMSETTKIAAGVHPNVVGHYRIYRRLLKGLMSLI